MRSCRPLALCSLVLLACTKDSGTRVRQPDAGTEGCLGASACQVEDDCGAREACVLLGACGTCFPDADEDGVPNLPPIACASGAASVACDNCPEVGNADQADQDGDHLGDACDANPKVANYQLHRGTLAPGGGLTVGATHDLVGTAGQPTAGAGELRTNRFRLRAGFAGAPQRP